MSNNNTYLFFISNFFENSSGFIKTDDPDVIKTLISFSQERINYKIENKTSDELDNESLNYKNKLLSEGESSITYKKYLEEYEEIFYKKIKSKINFFKDELDFRIYSVEDLKEEVGIEYKKLNFEEFVNKESLNIENEKYTKEYEYLLNLKVSNIEGLISIDINSFVEKVYFINF